MKILPSEGDNMFPVLKFTAQRYQPDWMLTVHVSPVQHFITNERRNFGQNDLFGWINQRYHLKKGVLDHLHLERNR